MSHERALGNESFISKGPLFQVTLFLFLPLALSMILSATVGLVDMFIASFLGSAAQAAVGLGDQMLFFVIVLGTGLSTACSSFVSRCAGARNYLDCRRYANCSLILAVGLGLAASILAIVFARPLLSVLGASPEVAQLAEPYTVYNALGNAPFVVSLCLSAIFRALGKTRQSVYLWLMTAVLANIISAAIFFGGYRSLNALAIGWDLGAVLGCLCGLFSYRGILADLNSHHSALEQNSTAGAPAAQPRSSVSRCCNFKAIKELLILGVPAILSEMSLVLSHFLMYRIFACSADSATLQAAWTVKLKLEEVFGLIPLMALGMATAVIVGQSLGAGLRERAVRASLGIAGSSAAAMLLLGALMSLAAPQLATAFCQEPACRQAVVALLNPSAILMPLTALGSIACAALEGAGLTQLPMRLNVAFQVFGRASLAYFFSITLGMGLAGVGLGLCLAQALMLLALLIWALTNTGRAVPAVPCTAYNPLDT